MAQVDDKNASAGKRARTDGSLLEDGWTCPRCGSANFSFRTSCNMRGCIQSRPADHNRKSAPKPLQTPQPYSSSAGYMGPMAPSSMYLAAPPYGSSVFSGDAPYDRPFSGGSPYHYDYGRHLSVGSPYEPLHLSGPPHYTSGSLFGSGDMYGVPPTMDKYNFGFSMGPSSGAFPEESSQKKLADAGGDNVWICPNCANNNLSFRTVCNMKNCNTPRPGPSSGAFPEESSQKKLADAGGDNVWICPNCANNNLSFRTVCNMKNCNTPRPGLSSGAFPDDSSQKKLADAGGDNDWKCPNCANNNFSFRTVCNMKNCKTPRPASMSENSKGSRPQMPEGSWKCEKCNNLNYSFRTKCNRQNCGAEKPPELNKTSDEDDQASMSENSKGPQPEGSWNCKKCKNLNYPFRTKCNRCDAEKLPELNKTSDEDDQAAKSENSKGSKPKKAKGSWKCKKCKNRNYSFRTKCNRPSCGAEKPPESNQTSDEDDQ